MLTAFTEVFLYDTFCPKGNTLRSPYLAICRVNLKPANVTTSTSIPTASIRYPGSLNTYLPASSFRGLYLPHMKIRLFFFLFTTLFPEMHKSVKKKKKNLNPPWSKGYITTRERWKGRWSGCDDLTTLRCHTELGSTAALQSNWRHMGRNEESKCNKHSNFSKNMLIMIWIEHLVISNLHTLKILRFEEFHFKSSGIKNW